MTTIAESDSPTVAKTGGSVTSKPPRWYHGYRELIEEDRRPAVLFATLSIFSGLLEGGALVAILPLLQAVLPGSPAQRGLSFAGLSVTMSKTWLAAASLGLFGVVGLGSSLFHLLSETEALRVRYRAEERMRVRLTALLLDTRWPALTALRTGEVTAAVLVDPARTAEGLIGFLRMLSSSATAVVFVAVAAALSPTLTAFTVGFGAFGLVVYKFVTRRAEERMRALSAVAEEITNQISDTFSNLKFFRTGGLRDVANDLMGETYRAYAVGNVEALRYGVVLRFVLETAGVIFITAILAVAVASSGGLTPTSVVFLAVFYRLAPRLMGVQDQLHLARVAVPWWDSWKARAKFAADNQEEATAGLPPSFNERICVDQVTFQYPGYPSVVLSDVSFDVQVGSFIAVVGTSGSGKTTLLDLVTGLLRPTSGSVTLDGVPISDLNLEEWQSRIGLVMQDSPLFHASVLRNVTLDATKPDLGRVKECLELADAAEFVYALPDGLDTTVGERGGRLSGGQRQRLGLARALYRNPWLLVLDEPTSALDGQSEAAILASLQKVKGRFAVLMVSHRMSTVSVADQIVVLEEGRVVEAGRWSELLSRPHGVFAAMAARQGITTGASP